MKQVRVMCNVGHEPRVRTLKGGTMPEKERVMTVFGSMPYREGYTGDRYQYSVLAIDRIPKEDKEVIRAKIKTLATGKEAQGIIGDGWTYEILDKLGRVGVLKRNGVEVALFLQRQMTREQPAPGDPLPECVGETDRWQRLDVLGPSARQANFFTKQELERLRERVGLLTQQNENLRELSDGFEVAAERKQQEIEALQETIKKLRLELSPKDQIIVKKNGFRYLTAEQAKKARELAAKRARRP